MTHEFWMTLFQGIFGAITAAFAAHYGAKKGSTPKE